MKPLRQIEATELMVSGKNYTVAFTAAIFGVTRREQLVKPEKQKTKSSSLLEEPTDSLAGDLAVVRRTYGQDVLALTVVCRYLETLIQNAEVTKYLERNHSGILPEIRHLVGQVNTERTTTQ
jgi:hypothetical protein